MRVRPSRHIDGWTADRLRECLNDCAQGSRVLVLANREPFRHERGADGCLTVVRSASGLVTALEPVLQACHGVWIAHGSGSADRDFVDRHGGVDVPPQNPEYRLQRVWLDAAEEQHYYDGFANEGLWPLCHRAGVAPIFRAIDFGMYAHVNEKFAAAAAVAADSSAPVVLVQDYHFALAPRMIRMRLPLATIIAFWHVPWPEFGALEQCPWRRDLVVGLLGSTIVGFHTDRDCSQFLDAAARVLGAGVDRVRGVVRFCGRETSVRAYPISIAWPSPLARDAPTVDACRSAVARRLHLPVGAQIIVGVDRLDYTKGICEKALAFERLLESRPDYRGRVTFVQIAEPSRQRLPAYRDLRTRLRAIVERVNGRFGLASYQPIVLCETHHDPGQVYEYLRAADVCYVGSLHDGMNLVAKEFVAARDDERGVLVLSTRAGAAEQLTAAVLVDPSDTVASARALNRALEMSSGEQAVRMRAMRRVVAEFNSYWWAGRMLQDAAALRTPVAGRRRELSLARKLIRVVREQRVDPERVEEVPHFVPN